MRKLTSLLFLVILFSVGFFSCKKDPDKAPDMGYNYFPDQVGRFVVYDVDSIYYDENNIDAATHIAPSIEFKFQVKEKIESIYTDNQNRPTIRLERYVKYFDGNVPYSQMPWIFRNVWAENKTATTAEKVEENIRYIRLSFPVKASQTWNGNAQNTQDAINYSYSSIDQPLNLGLLAFDSVMQVTQQDETTLISKKYSIEKYCRKVGLIYKEYLNIESQPPSGWSGAQQTAYYQIPITQRPTKGTKYTMTAAYYGTE